MINIEIPPRDGRPFGRRLLSRIADILVSVLFLLTLFPLIYVAVAIYVKRCSPGPAIVLRRRRRADGHEYHAYYFRLRDEQSALARMPQMLNVLRGEMRMWFDVRILDEDTPVEESVDELVEGPVDDIVDEPVQNVGDESEPI